MEELYLLATCAQSEKEKDKMGCSGKIISLYKQIEL